MKRSRFLPALLVLLAATTAALAAGDAPADYASAKALAAERGHPLVLDFMTDW